MKTGGREDEEVIGQEKPKLREQDVVQFAEVEAGWGVRWWERYEDVA